MNLHRSGWMGAFLALKAIGAEVVPQQCARGDSACYTRQHRSVCTIRDQAAPQACLDWVVSLEERANNADLAALRAQADAYGYLATLLATGGAGQVSAKQSAIKKYRELLLSDPGDAGAMLGIATFSESATERIDLLREVVRLKPHQISVEAFIRELRELSTIRGSSPDRAIELLDSICGPHVAKTIGARHCLDALELTVASLGQIPDRQGAQRLADRTAAMVGELVRVAGRELAEADPDWNPTVTGLLERIPAQGFGSLTTWAITARVDPTPAGRARALEQAVPFAPDNATVLSDLGVAYLEEGRRDDAVAVYRRARAVTPPDRLEQLRELDHYIRSAESRAAGSTPAPR